MKNRLFAVLALILSIGVAAGAAKMTNHEAPLHATALALPVPVCPPNSPKGCAPGGPDGNIE